MWDLSSLIRNQSHAPCTGRQILNHWTTAETSCKKFVFLSFSYFFDFPNLFAMLLSFQLLLYYQWCFHYYITNDAFNPLMVLFFLFICFLHSKNCFLSVSVILSYVLWHYVLFKLFIQCHLLPRRKTVVEKVENIDFVQVMEESTYDKQISDLANNQKQTEFY